MSIKQYAKHDKRCHTSFLHPETSISGILNSWYHYCMLTVFLENPMPDQKWMLKSSTVSWWNPSTYDLGNSWDNCSDVFVDDENQLIVFRTNCWLLKWVSRVVFSFMTGYGPKQFEGRNRCPIHGQALRENSRLFTLHTELHLGVEHRQLLGEQLWFVFLQRL